MPELPEVEIVRLGLSRKLPGRKIKKTTVLREASVGHPHADQFSRLVTGHTFHEVKRRGKYLLIDLDKGAGLAVHLRMSGRLLMDPKAKVSAPHVRIRFDLDNGEKLLFEDMRVFGRIWYIPKGKTFEEIIPTLAELGPEPLDDSGPEQLAQALKKRSQSIKTALLDQTVIAGIGNIYADECLYLAKIHPLRPARDVSAAELKVLRRKISFVLRQAIELGGSTLRNYTDSSGVNGNYQSSSLVYGRAGQPCRTCKTPIARLKIAGRSAHFCPKCQRR